ncbi:MAG: hypothetical protein Q9175_004106 [Cornicularia normoerica]
MPSALPEMRPKEFLRQLPEAQDLTDDDECPVCLQKYVCAKTSPPGIIQSLFSIAVRREPESIETEHAVRLPCQHILGSKCIKRWISPAGGNQNTCPYCVQKLFTPVKYPVSNHPHWDTLIDLLGGYGYTMRPNGHWSWDRAQGAAAISRKDLLDCLALAETSAAKLKRQLLAGQDTSNLLQSIARVLVEVNTAKREGQFPADQNTMNIVQKLTSSRLTVHLRETLLYLQLQSIGVDLPIIEEVSLEYPFRTLKKHQEDALFEEWERRKMFDNQSRNLSHREIWNFTRNLGFLPNIKWVYGE